MSEYKSMTLEELKQSKQELDVEISRKSEEIVGSGDNEGLMDQYNALLKKRSAVEKAIAGSGLYERLHGHKRPLPEAPDKPLAIAHYFDKKKKLEDREQDFEKEYDAAVAVVEGLSETYKDTVLYGTQEEIERLYDDLEQFKRSVKIAESKMQTLADAKDRVLDDAAMEIYLSRGYYKRHDAAFSEYMKVLQDRGDKSGQGTGLTIKYRPVSVASKGGRS